MNYTKESWSYLKNTLLAEKLYGGRSHLYGIKPQLHIIAAAWLLPNGDIYTGDSHVNAMERAWKLFGNDDAEDALTHHTKTSYEYLHSKGWKDGFLTSDEDWVSRQEALQIDKSSNQVNRYQPGIVGSKQLDSYNITYPARV